MNIKQALDFIINSKVISSVSGGFTGSLWLIDFENNNSIYIHCSWRIERNNKLLVTSSDDITPNTGLLVCSVRKLEKNKLLGFKLTKQNDLILQFENEYCVRVFCDIPSCPKNDFHSYRKNWSISLEDMDLTFFVNNQLLVEIIKDS